MGRKHHTPEQIIRKLREGEIELAARRRATPPSPHPRPFSPLMPSVERARVPPERDGPSREYHSRRDAEASSDRDVGRGRERRIRLEAGRL